MDRRRSSYASVAAGTAVPSVGDQSQPVRSGVLAHLMNPSSSPGYPQPLETDMPLPSITQQPYESANPPPRISEATWGKSSGGARSYWNPTTYTGYQSSQATSGSMFIRPSYLRGSKYMEKLEEAYKAKAAAQREATSNGQPNANGGSLSASSSSVSLHRMAPSHRGMTYEIVEHQPPEEDDVVCPLPSKWAEVDKYGGLEVSPEGQDVFCTGHFKAHDHDAFAARTDHYMPHQCGIYYYEVTVVSKGKEGMIGVGFSAAKASLEKLPGWEPDSWAYHGDDGKSFCGHSTGKDYGPTFTTGDVVGCGINFRTGTAFFTKNGVFLGNAFKDIKDVKLFPSIGMKRPGANAKVNFGQDPFMYDIDGLVAREKAIVREEISATDASGLHPPLGEADLIKELVSQFLRHDGCVKTAKAFADERRTEAAALKKDTTAIEDAELSQDIDAVNRQQIRSAILDGDIDRALKRTQMYYPSVLDENPQIYFRLRCRKFVEMMRQAVPPPKTKSLNGAGPTMTPTTEDAFEQEDMDVDEPNGANGNPPMDDWDRMETEEAVDGAGKGGATKGGAGIQDPMLAMVETLRYGEELKREYKDDGRKEVKQALAEIFALFAYEDPRFSPTAQVMDPSGRAPVAEELNSAILVSLGRSSSAAIERVCQQAEVLVSEISDLGGAGAFINVIGDLQH